LTQPAWAKRLVLLGDTRASHHPGFEVSQLQPSSPVVRPGFSWTGERETGPETPIFDGTETWFALDVSPEQSIDHCIFRHFKPSPYSIKHAVLNHIKLYQSTIFPIFQPSQWLLTFGSWEGLARP
jgi:hypothetical protein